MHRLARLFSALCLAALVAGAAALWLRPPSSPPSLPPGTDLPETALSGPLDRILIEKSARRITLYQNGQQVRIWPIALGFAPSGDKEKQGDGRTPEGSFTIDRRNSGSAYHLSLGLDYPQPKDIAHYVREFDKLAGIALYGDGARDLLGRVAAEYGDKRS